MPPKPKLPDIKPGLRRKTLEEMATAIRRNRVIPRVGWTQTQDGLMPPPMTSAEAGDVRLKWALKSVPNESGDDPLYEITPGMLYHGDDAQTITDVDLEFTPATGKAVYLETDAVSDPEWTLVFDTTPTAAYTFSEAGEMATYRRVIVEFLETEPSDGTSQAGELFARYRVPDADLALNYAIVADGVTGVVAVELIPA